MKSTSRYIPIAEYYDAECASVPMLQRDVPFMMEHLPKRRLDVLAIACGTGRAAIPVAQAGHRVVGVEIDPAMLAVAQRKRDAVGLDDSSLKFVHGDALSFNLRQRFDWVFLLFNTLLNFTELEHLDQLLTNVVRHLKPNGRFWVDILNPDPHLLAQRNVTDLDPMLFHVPALERTVMRTVSIRRDRMVNVQQVTHHYAWLDSSGRERREQVRFRMTFLFPRELQLLLERHGMVITTFYGDYNHAAVASDSPRLISLCRRKGS